MSKMNTKNRLENDLKAAIRGGDELRKRTLRMALAAIQMAEIDKKGEIEESAILSLIQKEIRSHQESIEDARRAGRPDLEKAASDQIQILEGYLPKQLNAEEIETIAQQVINELGASSPREMGLVMKTLMPRLAGRASGDQVSQVVRKMLQ